MAANAPAAPNRFDFRPSSEIIRAAFENRDYINSILQRPSGQHAINEEKKNQWIAAQLGEYRRHLAKKLIDNTRYVTHEEFIEKIRKTITTLYENPGIHDKQHFWLVMPPDKSGYWITAMAYYYLPEEHKPKINFIKLSDISKILDEPVFKEARLFFIDDMAYSGSQFNQFFTRFIEHNFIEKNANYNTKLRAFGREQKYIKAFTPEKARIIRELARDIYFVPIFISQNTYNKFKGSFKWRSVILNKDLKYPLKLFPGEIVESLYNPHDFKKMSLQEFADCCGLFNPGAKFQSTVSIYFDHKLADTVSTFMKVIEYGVVPPSQALDGDLDFKYLKYIFTDPDVKKKIECECININLELDKLDSDKLKIEKTDFIPFLNNCNIHIPPEWRDMSYRNLMETDEYRETERIKPNITINSPEERCPISWYKRGGERRGKTKRRFGKRKQKRTRKHS